MDRYLFFVACLSASLFWTYVFSSSELPCRALRFAPFIYVKKLLLREQGKYRNHSILFLPPNLWYNVGIELCEIAGTTRSLLRIQNNESSFEIAVESAAVVMECVRAFARVSNFVNVAQMTMKRTPWGQNMMRMSVSPKRQGAQSARKYCVQMRYDVCAPFIPPVANVEIAISRGRFVIEKSKLRWVAGMAPLTPVRRAWRPPAWVIPGVCSRFRRPESCVLRYGFLLRLR